MAGSMYIWIMLAFFLATGGVVLALVVMLWIGHLAEKSETGAKHGFLELPTELRSPDPAPPPSSPPGDVPPPSA
jgi:hypothetical protein